VPIQSGAAEPDALDARKVSGKTIVVVGGRTGGRAEAFRMKNAVPPEASPKSGFFRVFELTEAK